MKYDLYPSFSFKKEIFHCLLFVGGISILSMLVVSIILWSAFLLSQIMGDPNLTAILYGGSLIASQTLLIVGMVVVIPGAVIILCWLRSLRHNQANQSK